ncbi:MAG TPA: hypothetical protein VF868_03230 [Bacteroidia bacterium]|jgi:hypothetical protein
MSEIDYTKFKCKQPDCQVAVTGVCLEGIFDTCTHKYLADNASNDSPKEDAEEAKNVDANYKGTYSGEAMRAEECHSVASASLTRLIVLAGSVDAGKTTLLASLFQLFQERNDFAEYKFAGSQTLIGLEKRCFKSRLTSDREKATTDRTILLDDDEFIHLKVKKLNGNKVDLLFTDVSGEKFKNFANSSEECKKFELAKRADHFVLFIDSDSLSDKAARQNIKTSSLNILRGLIETEMLRPETYIEIVFSRWDLLLAKADVQLHKEFAIKVKEEILQKYGTINKRISFYEIASRPNSELDFGYGIDKLLPEWAEKSPHIPEKIVFQEKDYLINENSREAIKYKF